MEPAAKRRKRDSDEEDEDDEDDVIEHASVPQGAILYDVHTAFGFVYICYCIVNNSRNLP